MKLKKLFLIAMLSVCCMVVLNGCGSGSNDDNYDYTGLETFTDSFNSGVLADQWETSELPDDQALTFVTTPVRAGKYAVKFNLDYNDRVGSSCRAELRLPSQPQLGENWYGFSIYIPTGYTPDTEYDDECVAQWHNIPDTNLGESWTQPPIMLILSSGGYWTINRMWDPAKVTPSDPADYVTAQTEWYEIGRDTGTQYTADCGRWVDWVFHIKWGWLASQNPILEVYKDGELVFERNGQPNTSNDKKGPYFKIGIYKTKWINATTAPSINNRVIYHDEVRIGDKNSSFKAVSP
jgi:hypothetical protein